MSATKKKNMWGAGGVGYIAPHTIFHAIGRIVGYNDWSRFDKLGHSLDELEFVMREQGFLKRPAKNFSKSRISNAKINNKKRKANQG
ncbi:MAG: hypothetical protein KGL39_40160 [Patescibacteria group bacterium]|nr:hypothetical protein [Patescibacteria group bacterium]